MHVYNEAVTQAFSFPSNAICAICRAQLVHIIYKFWCKDNRYSHIYQINIHN